MYNYHIGEYIKRKREEKEIKQDELCYGICDRSTLSRIERGKQEPSYYILKALLQRLGISEDRCQILMGPQEFEISELQREIVADNVRKDFSSALKKIRRLEELSQSAENPLLQQFILRVRTVAGSEKDGERHAYTRPVQRKILIHAEEGNRRQAIEIYRQLIRYVQSHFAGCEIGQVMLPLTAYNYSRLLGQERRYEEAIEIAELGRECCIRYNKCQVLGGLLLNIAYCLHELGEDEKSRELLIDSYHISKAMEQTRSCEVVRKYAKENLQIEIG